MDVAATGPRWLSDPVIARCVAETLVRGAEMGHYVLHAYVVMPNHVHVLLDPLRPLIRITATVKGVSAHDANEILGRTGNPFWQHESFDHWVRNSAQFEKIKMYIENNPVKAGLAKSPGEWRWSSAYKA
ncbi:MAG: transposase [Candidatus Acidiferrales bacterium]